MCGACADGHVRSFDLRLHPHNALVESARLDQTTIVGVRPTPRAPRPVETRPQPELVSGGAGVLRRERLSAGGGLS